MQLSNLDPNLRYDRNNCFEWNNMTIYKPVFLLIIKQFRTLYTVCSVSFFVENIYHPTCCRRVNHGSVLKLKLCFFWFCYIKITFLVDQREGYFIVGLSDNCWTSHSSTSVTDGCETKSSVPWCTINPFLWCLWLGLQNPFHSSVVKVMVPFPASAVSTNIPFGILPDPIYRVF
jgi:hypothetical protein